MPAPTVTSTPARVALIDARAFSLQACQSERRRAREHGGRQYRQADVGGELRGGDERRRAAAAAAGAAASRLAPSASPRTASRRDRLHGDAGGEHCRRGDGDGLGRVGGPVAAGASRAAAATGSPCARERERGLERARRARAASGGARRRTAGDDGGDARRRLDFGSGVEGRDVHVLTCGGEAHLQGA